MGTKTDVYLVETEITEERRRGPWGVFKWKKVVTLPTGIEIRRGESKELFDAEGVKIGVATFNEEGLRFAPQEGVELSFDFGDEIRDFSCVMESVDEQGRKKEISTSITTTFQSLTIRSPNRGKKVILKRLS